MSQPQPLAPEPKRDERLIPCSNCGRHRRAGDAFCPHCGVKLESAPAAAPSPVSSAQEQRYPTPPPMAFKPEPVVYGGPAMMSRKSLEETRDATPPPQAEYPPQPTVYGVPAIQGEGKEAPKPPVPPYYPPPAPVYGGPAIVREQPTRPPRTEFEPTPVVYGSPGILSPGPKILPILLLAAAALAVLAALGFAIVWLLK